MSNEIPTQMRAWQYSKTAGGLENQLKLNDVPVPKPKPDQHLIRVIAVGLNPVDFKIVETPVIGGYTHSKPATPGVDISGEIVVPATGSSLKVGQLVYGAAAGDVQAGGALAEYALAAKDRVVAIPDGVSVTDAASLTVSALTAYQSIVSNANKGDRILVNGGSGGVGIFATQIARIIGCHVTVTCSSRNVELCKSFGADEVIDYTKGDVITSLKALSYKFDLIVDGVGNDHALYWKSNQYTNSSAKFICVAYSPLDMPYIALTQVLPRFLGGPRAKNTVMFADLNENHMKEIVAWVQQGKLKTRIEGRYPMEDVPEAYRTLKAGRTRGKLVVNVTPQ